MIELIIFIFIFAIMFCIISMPPLASAPNVSNNRDESMKNVVSILRNDASIIQKNKMAPGVRFADTRTEVIYSKKTNKIVGNITADT